MEEIPVQVFIVDDEPEVAEGLVWLLDSIKVPSRVFTSATPFFHAMREVRGPVCAVLDLRMPEMSGLEIQKRLVDEGLSIPLFFLSAHGDIPAAVNAMQLGAVDFLQKPFNPQSFLDAVNRIQRLARDSYAQRMQEGQLQRRLDKLSARELEVMNALLKGRTSKEIARILDISPKTVDVHRANVFRKLEVSGTAELLRLMSDRGVPAG